MGLVLVFAVGAGRGGRLRERGTLSGGSSSRRVAGGQGGSSPRDAGPCSPPLGANNGFGCWGMPGGSALARAKRFSA